MFLREKTFWEQLKIKAARAGIALAILLAMGSLASICFERKAWQDVKKTMPEISLQSASKTAGTGLALGTLGGFRTVLADIAWIRAFHFWNMHDWQSCDSLISLARTLDPQNYFFWENSVNYKAYDFPVWIVNKRGGYKHVSERVQCEIHRRAFEDATALIEEMAIRFPGQGKVWAFAAQISLIKTERIYGKADFELALKYYMKAMESEKVPWFCFFAYGNIVKHHFPEKIPETRNYLEKRLAKAKTLTDRKVLSDALEEFNRNE